jgi:hypothetical protein
MSDGNDSTETLIESLHASRKKHSIVINPDYLDDEKLPEQDRTRVLREIFNRNMPADPHPPYQQARLGKDTRPAYPELP